MVSRQEFARSIGKNINDMEEVLVQLKALKKSIEDRKTDLAQYALVAGQAFLDEGRKVQGVSGKLFELSEQVDEIA